MQTFDLVHPVADIVKHLVESFFLDDLARSAQEKQGVRRNVVFDL